MGLSHLPAILRKFPIGRLVIAGIRELYERGIDFPQEKNIEGFWRSQGTRYMDDQATLPEWKEHALVLQEATLVEFLRSLQFRSALEVGCGYGRILRVINETFDTKLTGVDISVQQLQNAQKFVNDPTVELYRRNASDLLFQDGLFDLVLTVNVLLHIPPRKLDAVLKEILRVSRRHVVFVEPVKGDNRLFRKPFCWDHDYRARLIRLGDLKIHDVKVPLPAAAPRGESNRIIHGRKLGEET